MSTLVCKQVDVDMPWGILKTQIFGEMSEGKQAILAMHGYLDNSNSFKPIAPFITANKNYYIISFDIPGHGLSTHIPTGIYSAKLFLTCMRRVVKYFNLNSVILLGHSFGCILTLLYTSCYADEVDAIILLDFILNDRHKMNAITMPKLWNEGIDNIVAIYTDNEANKEPTDRVLTKEIALQKLLSASRFIDEEAGKLLLERGLVEKDGKLQFSRDIRVKQQLLMPDFYTDFHSIRGALKHYLNSPLLYIYAVPPSYGEEKYKNTVTFLQSLRQRKLIKMQPMEGTHHFHMLKAKETSGIILDFIENNVEKRNAKKLKSKL